MTHQAFRPHNLLLTARALSKKLLASNSATSALEAWCQDHRIGWGPITAHLVHDGPPLWPGDDLLDELRCEDPSANLAYRRVRLCRSGIVLSEASNWFVPARIPREMRDALATSKLPFGTVIGPLKPRRRTFAVRFSGLNGPEPACAPDARPCTVFEHKAVVLREDGVPIAAVHEKYQSTLFDIAHPANARHGDADESAPDRPGG